MKLNKEEKKILDELFEMTINKVAKNLGIKIDTKEKRQNFICALALGRLYE